MFVSRTAMLPGGTRHAMNVAGTSSVWGTVPAGVGAGPVYRFCEGQPCVYDNAQFSLPLHQLFAVGVSNHDGNGGVTKKQRCANGRDAAHIASAHSHSS
jgi:hypothetical protein